jgi:hypothetical protein
VVSALLAGRALPNVLPLVPSRPVSDSGGLKVVISLVKVGLRHRVELTSTTCWRQGHLIEQLFAAPIRRGRRLGGR